MHLPKSNIISILVTFSLLKTHRATVGSANLTNEYPEHGLVKDGTPCGDNLVCVNQTCVSIYPHIDQTKCPTNNMDMECFGHGVSEIFQNKIMALSGVSRLFTKTNWYLDYKNWSLLFIILNAFRRVVWFIILKRFMVSLIIIMSHWLS